MREVAELENLLISQRVVLIYAPSGAGKTSLIRAGLIPSLERRQLFRILPILRVGLPSDEGRATAANPYVLSTLRCIEAGLNTAEQLPPSELSKFTIAEYLDHRAPQAADARRPELLIFDQFEEIFSDPVNRDAKAEFFRQLGEALGGRDNSEGGRPAPLRRCLISMREDQIAKLDDFRAMIPGGLSNTFRVNLLDRAQAREAIMGPAERAGLAIDYEVVDRLVDELSRVHGADREASVPGDFVEPMFLQLVCFRMWSRAVASGKRRISVTDAETGAFASPEVDRILADFYDETLREIERETGVRERAMRDWFERSLITRSRVRIQVSLEDPRNAFIAEGAIHALNGRLLRTESRAGALWIELIHDRLIDPILRSNAAWREANLIPLQRQADLWNEAGRSADFLFSGEALDRAEEQAKELDLNEGDRAFLDASRRAGKRSWLGFLRGG
jgi:hypothetical protein